ncbi:oxysterol-binding protein [Plakobranchus ocellatus]|uniref:Oxysterol-binding protein n=1 Tax=Plakobranchus ocellatus TaxID=259542 RepID=A0AAV4A8C7_9GAST|nr:oxysterol-binding protein [Plakobranchus ocellatus]
MQTSMSSVDRKQYEALRLSAVHSAHRKKIAAFLEAKDREQEASREHRDTLPALMVNRKDISLWTILKSCIGKRQRIYSLLDSILFILETLPSLSAMAPPCLSYLFFFPCSCHDHHIVKDLSKISFPVILNEPISMIQRLCEYMEYSFLLERAAKADNPVDRIEFVCGFVTSALSSNWMRPGKPFNALLGETYELIRSDMGFKFLGEQVSHHPPVTALHVEGTGYEFHGSIAPGLSFWGKSVDVTPKGSLIIDLQK